MSDLPRLLTLREAAARLGGKVTASSLRNEAKKGRLQLITVAGKYHTTEAMLHEMLDRCLDAKSQPASSSESFRSATRLGTSSTANERSPQDALSETLRVLKIASRSTRAKSTTQPKTPEKV